MSPSNERSAEWLRGAVESHINTCNLITSITSATKSHPARQGLMAAGNELHNQLDRYRALLAAAEAREAIQPTAAEPKGIAAWLTDNHVRTKDGKLCCVEVRRPDTHGGMACTWKFNDFDLSAEIEGGEVGDEIVLRYVELTDAEFTALGDFDGW